MMTATEYITYNTRLELAEIDYELAKLNADWLGISIDEYYDFVADMDGEITDDITPEELEEMYVDYCREYEIPCLQIPNDYACYDKEGW
jgi:hypothetical protein